MGEHLRIHASVQMDRLFLSPLNTETILVQLVHDLTFALALAATPSIFKILQMMCSTDTIFPVAVDELNPHSAAVETAPPFNHRMFKDLLVEVEASEAFLLLAHVPMETQLPPMTSLQGLCLLFRTFWDNIL